VLHKKKKENYANFDGKRDSASERMKERKNKKRKNEKKKRVNVRKEQKRDDSDNDDSRDNTKYNMRR